MLYVVSVPPVELVRLSPDDKLSSLRDYGTTGVSIFEVWQMSPLLVKLGRGEAGGRGSISTLVTTLTITSKCC